MNRRGICIGLTGGIGCGKSTVANMFADRGAAVIDTDVIAHELTGPGGDAMHALMAAFGAGIADQHGALDRPAMRARVFADAGTRKQLEAILHPLIRAASQRRLASVTAPYALLVVPLLTEKLAEYRQLLDRIAVVLCDESQQIVRTSERAGLDLEQARAIVAAQASQAERVQIADDLVDNRSDLHTLERQVEHLHQLYSSLAKPLTGST